MVHLHTLRRVLAVDLGLRPEAIERCLREAVRGLADVVAIPLEEALRIIELAEGAARPQAA